MLLFGKKIFSIVKFLIDVEVFEMIYIILYIKEQFRFKEYFLKIIICEKNLIWLCLWYLQCYFFYIGLIKIVFDMISLVIFMLLIYSFLF